MADKNDYEGELNYTRCRPALRLVERELEDGDMVEPRFRLLLDLFQQAANISQAMRLVFNGTSPPHLDPEKRGWVTTTVSARRLHGAKHKGDQAVCKSPSKCSSKRLRTRRVSELEGGQLWQL